VAWVLVGVAVTVLLGVAIWAQQRHDDDLVALLRPLVGERLEMAITPTASKFAVIGRYVGEVASIDPSTRWVTFEWIELADDEQPLGVLPPDRYASNGVMADCFRWVESSDGRRIDLT
jgi:hypothetical protein